MREVHVYVSKRAHDQALRRTRDCSCHKHRSRDDEQGEIERTILARGGERTEGGAMGWKIYNLGHGLIAQVGPDGRWDLGSKRTGHANLGSGRGAAQFRRAAYGGDSRDLRGISVVGGPHGAPQGDQRSPEEQTAYNAGKEWGKKAPRTGEHVFNVAQEYKAGPLAVHFAQGYKAGYQGHDKRGRDQHEPRTMARLHHEGMNWFIVRPDSSREGPYPHESEARAAARSKGIEVQDGPVGSWIRRKLTGESKDEERFGEITRWVRRKMEGMDQQSVQNLRQALMDFLAEEENEPEHRDSRGRDQWPGAGPGVVWWQAVSNGKVWLESAYPASWSAAQVAAQMKKDGAPAGATVRRSGDRKQSDQRISQVCPFCGGTGRRMISGQNRVCPNCNGTGKAPTPYIEH